MGFELYVFDWSGMISDDRLPVYHANMNLLRKYRLPEMRFDEWLANTTMTAAEFLAANGVNQEAEVLSALYQKHYSQVVQNGLLPVIYPDVVPTFEQLNAAKKRLAVLSSHPRTNLKEEAVLSKNTLKTAAFRQQMKYNVFWITSSRKTTAFRRWILRRCYMRLPLSLAKSQPTPGTRPRI